eukprot:14666691-Alexandrium_andersonii.AAC.1
MGGKPAGWVRGHHMNSEERPIAQRRGTNSAARRHPLRSEQPHPDFFARTSTQNTAAVAPRGP